jgi:hypothetical protein
MNYLVRSVKCNDRVGIGLRNVFKVLLGVWNLTMNFSSCNIQILLLKFTVFAWFQHLKEFQDFDDFFIPSQTHSLNGRVDFILA